MENLQTLYKNGEIMNGSSKPETRERCSFYPFYLTLDWRSQIAQIRDQKGESKSALTDIQHKCPSGEQ